MLLMYVLRITGEKKKIKQLEILFLLFIYLKTKKRRSNCFIIILLKDIFGIVENSSFLKKKVSKFYLICVVVYGQSKRK